MNIWEHQVLKFGFGTFALYNILILLSLFRKEVRGSTSERKKEETRSVISAGCHIRWCRRRDLNTPGTKILTY